MIREREYDVIIVGAGPAGLKCAETLGNSKLSVLLLEQNKVIGPKVCAGGLSYKSVSFLKLPKAITEKRYDEINMHIGSKCRKINKKGLVYTISRKELGQWQLKKIKKFKNITIQTNSRVTAINKGNIVCNKKKIMFKYLVGADGSTSIVRRFIQKKPIVAGIGIQYVLPKKNFKSFEVYFDQKYFSAWYAWIFPHKTKTVVGCGCDPKILPAKQLKENFSKWLQERNINIKKGKYEAFPLSHEYQGYKFDNIFLTGDAAGLVSGLTGEGIYQALVSGDEIAKEIRNPQYTSKILKKIIRLKKQHDSLVKLAVFFGKRNVILFRTGCFLMRIPVIKKAVIAFIA